MKVLKSIAVVALVALTALVVNAQVVKKGAGDNNKKKSDGAAQISDRQQSFYAVKEPNDADLEWMKIVYRSLDLTKGKNGALYYPEEPNADGENLFFIIMKLLANDQISAYEYLDGREMFTDEYRIKVREMLDRFHILYTEAKGSTDKHPKFNIENADMPSNEVLSYYIIEKWEFDIRSNAMKTRVEAICPVLHRTDEFGGEAIKYPMFWVKLNDIRPYMANQYVFTDDDNNLPRYNLDDFFKLGMYTGDIYKTKNLRNLSLMQQFPDTAKLKHAQDSIEQRLESFDKNLWVPSREELQARAAAKAKLEAGNDSTSTEVKTTETKSVRKVSNKRGRSRSGNTTVKTRKPKSASVKQSSSNAGAVRSVRRRK
jgi:gliding motility associated protien GldN